MPFSSLPESEFYEAVYKTWIATFKDNTDIQALVPKVTAKMPDLSTGKFDKLPLLVMKRVASEEITLERNGGYHGKFSETVGTLKEVQGYTLNSDIQFDLYTGSPQHQLSIAGLIRQILQPIAYGAYSVIPVKNFSTDPIENTSLQIRFRYTDVTFADVPTFSPDLMQYSIKIPFWVHYWKDTDLSKILSIESQYNLSN